MFNSNYFFNLFILLHEQWLAKPILAKPLNDGDNKNETQTPNSSQNDQLQVVMIITRIFMY